MRYMIKTISSDTTAVRSPGWLAGFPGVARRGRGDRHWDLPPEPGQVTTAVEMGCEAHPVGWTQRAPRGGEAVPSPASPELAHPPATAPTHRASGTQQAQCPSRDWDASF